MAFRLAARQGPVVLAASVGCDAGVELSGSSMMCMMVPCSRQWALVPCLVCCGALQVCFCRMTVLTTNFDWFVVELIISNLRWRYFVEC
jgi:hypothetical protein